jgi:hypothetical protein
VKKKESKRFIRNQINNMVLCEFGYPYFLVVLHKLHVYHPTKRWKGARLFGKLKCRIIDNALHNRGWD